MKKKPKRWDNMSNDEQRVEFLRRLPYVMRAFRDMRLDDVRRLCTAALLLDPSQYRDHALKFGGPT